MLFADDTTIFTTVEHHAEDERHLQRVLGVWREELHLSKTERVPLGIAVQEAPGEGGPSNFSSLPRNGRWLWRLHGFTGAVALKFLPGSPRPEQRGIKVPGFVLEALFGAVLRPRVFLVTCCVSIRLGAISSRSKFSLTEGGLTSVHL